MEMPNKNRLTAVAVAVAVGSGIAGCGTETVVSGAEPTSLSQIIGGEDCRLQSTATFPKILVATGSCPIRTLATEGIVEYIPDPGCFVFKRTDVPSGALMVWPDGATAAPDDQGSAVVRIGQLTVSSGDKLKGAIVVRPFSEVPEVEQLSEACAEGRSVAAYVDLVTGVSQGQRAEAG